MSRHKFLVLIALLFAYSGSLYALPDDAKQPIHIAADRVDIDEPNGVSTYSGNVNLTQGSLKLSADSITVYTEKKQLKRIKALGSPAHVQQTPKADASSIKAHANQIDYQADIGLLILTEKAQFSQGPNLFRSSRIEYELENNIVRASKTADSPQRVEVIIEPSSVK